MALQYKYLERPKDVDTCIKLLHDDIIPLLKEHWDRDGQPFYKRPFELNVEAFARLWVTQGISIVIAYDNGTAVGIFVGVRFTPMNFGVQVLQVENCYGRTPEIESGLYNYIKSIASILGYEELWISTDMNSNPDCFKQISKSEIVRYSRD